MLKFMVVVYQRSDLTPDEFRRHLREIHGPLAMNLPGLRNYIQNFVCADPKRTPGWDAVIRAPIGQPLPHEDCVISEVQPPRDAVGNRFIRREKLGTRRNVREMARAGRGTIPRA